MSFKNYLGYSDTKPDAVTVALDCMEAMSRAKYDLATRSAHGILLDNARAQHAAMLEALGTAEALLGRIADEAASTQNTSRRCEGLMPLIDCRLIADVFRYVGARKVQP